MGSLSNVYIFLFFFAFGYLIAGKKVILAVSTRVVLTILFGCAVWFATSVGSTWHDLIGVATLILNVIFVAFGVMDYLAFVNNRSEV